MRLFCSLLFASAALFAQPQQTLPITKSVSNIKNNLAISPTGGLICQTEAKKPCTAQDVKEISGALNLAKLGIKPLTAGANGAVVCETTAGKPCTLDRLLLIGWMGPLNPPVRRLCKRVWPTLPG